MTDRGISPDLLAFETERAAALLHQMVDMVIVLDATHRVIDVSVQDLEQLDMARRWCNHGFVEVVGQESRDKCVELYSEDAARPDGSARWRHVNMSDGAGGTVPYLMKYARMPRDAGVQGLILARDLRPVLELQDRFQRATVEMEQRYEALMARRLRGLALVETPVEGTGAGVQRIGATIVRAMVAQISHRSLEQIVAETTGVLERLCIAEAIERSEGDRLRAADLLGITVEALYHKMVV